MEEAEEEDGLTMIRVGCGKRLGWGDTGRHTHTLVSLILHVL